MSRHTAHGVNTTRQGRAERTYHTNWYVSVILTGRKGTICDASASERGPAETSSSNPSSCAIPKRPYGERLCPALAQSERAYETPVRKGVRKHHYPDDAQSIVPILRQRRCGRTVEVTGLDAHRAPVGDRIETSIWELSNGDLNEQEACLGALWS